MSLVSNLYGVSLQLLRDVPYSAGHMGCDKRLHPTLHEIQRKLVTRLELNLLEAMAQIIHLPKCQWRYY